APAHGKPIEPQRLSFVLGQTAAPRAIKIAEVDLGLGIALGGGELEQARGFNVVLGDARAAVTVEDAELVLRVGDALTRALQQLLHVALLSVRGGYRSTRQSRSKQDDPDDVR